MTYKVYCVVLFYIQFIYLANTKKIIRINDQEIPVSESLFRSLHKGLSQAMEECKNSFKWERWNCPETAFSMKSTLKTREDAYVKALTSAAIVHSVSRDCASGENEDCGCSTSTVPKKFAREPVIPFRNEIGQLVSWSWGGCSDDTAYAENVTARIFKKSQRKLRTIDNFIDAHNERIGRQIVADTMMKLCRCHGISASCSLQTCWAQTAPFITIAKKLKDLYRKAIRIDSDFLIKENRIDYGFKERDSMLPSKSIIYVNESPNYCLENIHTDWPGTKGRKCIRKKRNETDMDLDEKRSCRRLCRSCGYRVKKTRKTAITECNCRFVWCCQVKCDVCHQVVDEHFCG